LRPSALLLLQPILGDLYLRGLAQAVDIAAYRFVADALGQLVARRFARLGVELGGITILDRVECDERIGVVGQRNCVVSPAFLPAGATA
jgi:hypothetical protein